MLLASRELIKVSNVLLHLFNNLIFPFPYEVDCRESSIFDILDFIDGGIHLSDENGIVIILLSQIVPDRYQLPAIHAIMVIKTNQNVLVQILIN